MNALVCRNASPEAGYLSTLRVLINLSRGAARDLAFPIALRIANERPAWDLPGWAAIAAARAWMQIQYFAQNPHASSPSTRVR